MRATKDNPETGHSNRQTHFGSSCFKDNLPIPAQSVNNLTVNQERSILICRIFVIERGEHGIVEHRAVVEVEKRIDKIKSTGNAKFAQKGKVQ